MNRKLASFARVLLFMLACAAMLMVAAPLAKPLSGKSQELLLGSVTSLMTFALTAVFVRWERQRLGDVGAMPDRGSLRRLAFGFLIGLLIITTWAVISVAAGQSRWVLGDRINVRAVALAAVTYLLLACREELAFHGYPLRQMQGLTGVWPAQIFIAFVFAMEHRLGGATWTDAFLGAGVGSLLFGMAAIATRGLAVPIGMHAAWNLGHWALGLKGTPGLWRAVVDEHHVQRSGLISIAIYDVVMLSAVFAFWQWHRRRGDARTS
jgi:membrane protease YdiL (CAAX protease family)